MLARTETAAPHGTRVRASTHPTALPQGRAGASRPATGQTSQTAQSRRASARRIRISPCVVVGKAGRRALAFRVRGRPIVLICHACPAAPASRAAVIGVRVARLAAASACRVARRAAPRTAVDRTPRRHQGCARLGVTVEQSPFCAASHRSSLQSGACRKRRVASEFAGVVAPDLFHVSPQAPGRRSSAWMGRRR